MSSFMHAVCTYPPQFINGLTLQITPVDLLPLGNNKSKLQKLWIIVTYMQLQ